MREKPIFTNASYYTIAPLQKVQSRFWLSEGSSTTFNLTSPAPNAWHRFWQRVFFGFRWERIDD